MSRFASEKLQQIDLWEGEWVKVLTSLSFWQVTEFTSKETESERVKSMFAGCIKEWNVVDENGNVPEITGENIMRLDFETGEKIASVLLPLLKNDQDKKKSRGSSSPASEGDEATS